MPPPPIFDASVQQIFAALCGGHRLVVVDAETRRNGRHLMDLLASERVTVSDATPSLLSMLLSLGFARREDLVLRHILVGGEALAAKVAREILGAPSCPTLRLTNVYGPTECTVDCSALTLDETDLADVGLISIGRPLGRARLLVLDRMGEPVPIGSPGEIHVGGPGLARGYLDPSQTAERFIQHADFGRLYRTGDLGVWDTDGKLHFLGRFDDQIKLRGYRIELAEIDAGLSRISGVRSAAATLRGQGDAAKLIAFVECDEGVSEDLRSAADSILPDYMVPAEIVRLDALPSTPSGKVDRRALTALRISKKQEASLLHAPRTARERAIAEIWSHVLDMPVEDMTTDFFVCGGHSLAAARLIGLVEETFAVTVSLRAFFDQPTPEGLCALIDSAPDAAASGPVIVPDGQNSKLSPAQYRLWAIDQMHGGSPGYAMPAAWRVTQRLDLEAFQRAVDMIVQRHEALRARFVMRAGEPVQVIAAEAVADVVVEDIAHMSDPMAEALARCTDEVGRPFDLENGPLLRARVWTVAEDEHVLFVNLHLIVADGHSLDILAAELWSAYAALAAGKVPDLGAPASSFRAHMARMRARADGPKAQSDLRYWQQVLTPLPEPLDLPSDRPRPPTRRQSGVSLDLTAGRSGASALAAVARTHRTTPFAVLTALSVYALYSLSGQRDLVLGIPVEGRPDRESRSVIGLCAETIPLRVTVQPEETFGALVDRVRSGLAEALDRLDCPFDRIVEAIDVPSRPDRSILFDTMVSYRMIDADPAPEGAEIAPLPLSVQGSQLDLALLFSQTPDALVLSLQYDDALFDAHRVEKIGQYVLSLAERCSRLMEQALDTLPQPDPTLLSSAGESATRPRAVLSGARLAKETAWWRKELSGLAEAIELPFDRPRPAVMDDRRGRVGISVPAPVTGDLKRLAREKSATLFMVLETAFAVLLSRLGAGEDVAVGTTVAGRPPAELEGLRGSFVNTVVLRNRIDLKRCFGDQLASSRTMVLDAFAHDGVPFEAVVEAVSPERPLRHAPLVQVMVVLQDTSGEGEAFVLGDPVGRAFESADRKTAQFELSLNLKETADGLAGSLSYASQLFDEATAARIGSMFERVVASVATAPETRLCDLALLDDAECSLVTTGFNDTAASYAQDRTVVDLFCDQALQRPDAAAVVDGENELSYRALDEASNRLARYLIEQGVGPERVVGVSLDRSAELIVSLLGIWKAGGAYLPLDPDYPAERLGFMIADAGASLVLTAKAHAGRLSSMSDGGTVRRVVVDDTHTAGEITAWSGAAVGDDDRRAPLTPASLAYVIYTSGSTGKPKGVMVGHDGVCAYLNWTGADYALRAGDAVPINTAFSFDATVTSLWLPLVSGACCVPLPSTAVILPFADFLNSDQAKGIVKTTPGQLRLLPDGLASACEQPPRKFIVGGEPLLGEDLKAWAAANSAVSFVNEYGPTETVVGCVTFEVGAGDPITGSVPIGRPVANTQVYVVDDHLNPVPVGVNGELLIGGVQVSRGYLGRPALTAEKFIADPFSGRAGARLYRTGDVARWRLDGTLEFLGRLDTQVKVRGMRVEPGEIEAALHSQPGIAQAVVVARGEGGETGSQTELVAYLVPEDVADDPGGSAAGDPVEVVSLEGLLDLEVLRSALQAVLPDHMVPGRFVGVSHVPLTSSDKVNRKALPKAAGSVARAAYAAPVMRAEQLVAALYAELLGLDRVGREDGFFALGGHSLTAARLVQRIYTVFGVELRLSDIMSNPTVAGLAGHLSNLAATDIDHVKRLPDGLDYALSPAQRRFWVLEQLEGQQGYGLLPGMVELTGAVDEAALAEAVAALCTRHESLRTVIVTDPQGVPRQRIMAAGTTLASNDLRQSDDPEAAAQAWFESLLAQPFEMSSEPLFRIGLARTGPQRFLLGFCLHHIIADGWSMDVLMRDLSALYAAARGTGPQPAALQRQFRDCAAHQAERAEAQQDLDYWRGQLSGPPARLDLPTDRPRPKRQDVRGALASFRLDSGRTGRLQHLAKERGLTLFTTLTAAFQTFLYRYSGQVDLTLGTPVAGRDHPDYADQVGLFLNQLALRVTLDPASGFEALLDETRATIQAALENQNASFDTVVEALDLPRDLDRGILFDAMIVMQDPDHGELNLDDVSIVSRTQAADVAKADLSLIVDPRGNEIEAHFEYAVALFDPETIEEMIGIFGAVVDAVTADPAAPLEALEVVADKKRQTLLAWGGLASDLPPANDTILDAIAGVAETMPQAPATSDGDRIVSYGDLTALSDNLARQLVLRGVAAGARVGIELPRDARLPAVLLGVLKAGAAFVPLDPVLPEARRELLIEQAGCAAVLSEHADGGLRHHVETLLDAPQDDVSLPEIGHDMLAYLLFTSGSTGKPKGVMIEHGALAAFCRSLPETFGLEPEDRIAALTNISFDISILELLGGLTFGACIVAIGAEDAMVPEQTLGALKRQRATVLQTTPTRLALLMDAAADEGPDPFAAGTALRTVLTGGEVLPSHLRDRLAALSHLAVHEVYGPTETTIWSCARRITEPAQADLGRPLPGEGVAVLSSGGALQPVGAPGEIVLFGAGLARGYLDDPERTGRVFVDGERSLAGRFYRTGDLARWRADGRLEFLGRSDGQIKIRGHRIETGEVEAALSKQPDIRQAAVELRGAGADAMLVAHVAAETLDTPSLLSALRAKLPDAAVPGRILRHEQLPLLPSGKIDRKALANITLPEQEETDGISAETSYNSIEAEIAAVFASLLDRRAVEPDTGFFDMGGHSLLAAQAVRQLRDKLGRQIDLGDIFAAPTVRALADTMRSRRREDWPPLVASSESTAYHLSHPQKRIWAAQQLSKGSDAYIIHAAIRIEGKVRIKALKKAFSAVIARHGALRTAFLSGIDGPRQHIHDAVSFTLERSRADDDTALSEILKADASEPFDMAQAPLLRARLIDTRNGRRVLSVSLHHAVADGRSLELFMRDLETAYMAAVDGRDSSLPAQTLQYTDYALWEHKRAEAASMEADRDFWRRTMADLAERFDLPFAQARAKRRHAKAATFQMRLSPDQTQALRKLATARSATVFAVLLAAFSALVQRLTGREDVVFGTAAENRELSALDDMIGCFVNLIPLRMAPSADMGISDLIAQARRVIGQSLRHGHVSFEEIVQASGATTPPGRSPLFDIAVTWNELDHTARTSFAGLPIADVTPAPAFAKYDLLLTFSPAEDGGIACVFEFSNDLYSQEDMENLATWLSRVVEQITTAPEGSIMDLDIGVQDNSFTETKTADIVSILDI